MRRREFTVGLLLVAAQSVRAQQRAKLHRIAIVITAGPVTRIDDPGSRAWRAATNALDLVDAALK